MNESIKTYGKHRINQLTLHFFFLWDQRDISFCGISVNPLFLQAEEADFKRRFTQINHITGLYFRFQNSFSFILVKGRNPRFPASGFV